MHGGAAPPRLTRASSFSSLNCKSSAVLERRVLIHYRKNRLLRGHTSTWERQPLAPSRPRGEEGGMLRKHRATSLVTSCWGQVAETG